MGKYLVIGGTSGIGAAIVKRLSGAGHEIVSTFRKAAGEALPGVTYHQFDSLDRSGQIDFVPDVLDGLVYCPGSISLKPFNRISTDDLLKDYESQVAGLLSVMKSVASRLKASGNASVVTFSTVAVSVGMPFHALVAATKGAVEGMSRALAAELAPIVRVNCIAPSLTDTPLASSLLGSPEKREGGAQRHPLKRIGTPEDLAAMAYFLLSQESSWITGQVLHVDGGISSLR